MAFITAGMGGGTGTGGAPILAKICKDLGILTVGIVTTPFAYEGKKRIAQAEEGIMALKSHVDTLLVISNDKLRHQFGNLKMKEAFAKADNVLATAAKCITDVINSTGQINVDFADVCTVMSNGGVAILGSAAAEGENRAQEAIENALNSPLLNDNDIRGAKWILININSSEGDHEFTMDEVEVIQNYLLSHAGEDTDVILGLGYDNTLGSSIGITLIATGFEHKDPFNKAPKKTEVVKNEKIVMESPTVGNAQKISIIVFYRIYGKGIVQIKLHRTKTRYRRFKIRSDGSFYVINCRVDSPNTTMIFQIIGVCCTRKHRFGFCRLSFLLHFGDIDRRIILGG